MTIRSRITILLATLAAGLPSGCSLHSDRALERPGQLLVVLLPDADSGTVGRVVVSNAAGSTELSTAYASTRINTSQTPTVRGLSESEVTRRFGDIIATLPPPSRHFTLLFRFDSEQLTDEGAKLVQDVLQAVKRQPVPDVVVVGHTDTTGTPQSNAELGLRRANAVRTLLIDAGLGASAIEVRSHGEAELLVKTADGVFEPRNRRVEITVR